jgi:hypothetical protein
MSILLGQSPETKETGVVPRDLDSLGDALYHIHEGDVLRRTQSPISVPG